MRRRWRTALALTAALGAAAALYVMLSGDGSLARVRQAGVIRIGYAIEAPYSFLGPHGEVTGESPETARAVVARLGIPRIEWRLMSFDELIPELQSGAIDVVAAGMFKTPKRSRMVRFSIQTFAVHLGFLVAAGNPLGLHALRDIVGNAGVKVAVLAGSVEEQMMQRRGIPASRLVSVENARAGLLTIQSGMADALVLSSPTVGWMASQDTSHRVTAVADPGPAQDVSYGLGGFAFARDERTLADAWDDALARYLETPAHRDLLAHFGFRPADEHSAASPQRDSHD